METVRSSGYLFVFQLQWKGWSEWKRTYLFSCQTGSTQHSRGIRVSKWADWTLRVVAWCGAVWIERWSFVLTVFWNEWMVESEKAVTKWPTCTWQNVESVFKWKWWSVCVFGFGVERRREGRVVCCLNSMATNRWQTNEWINKFQSTNH